MKRLSVFLLLLLIVFSVCACTFVSPEEYENYHSGIPVTPTPEPAATPAPTPVPTPEPTPEPDVIPVCSLSAGNAGESAMQECESLAGLNGLCGGKLSAPTVAVVEDEGFFSFNCGSFVMGEYRFSIDGSVFCLRAAVSTEDISGIISRGRPLFAEGRDGILTAGKIKAARWFAGGIQYVLVCADSKGTENEFFGAVVDDITMNTYK